MRKVIVFCLLTFLVSGAFGQYNPEWFTVSNKSYGMAQAGPVDARSYYFDTVTFAPRPYASTAEVLAWLNQPRFRTGHFPIFISFGAVVKEYWFKNGTADSNLVEKWLTPEMLWARGQFRGMNSKNILYPINYADTVMFGGPAGGNIPKKYNFYGSGYFGDSVRLANNLLVGQTIDVQGDLSVAALGKISASLKGSGDYAIKGLSDATLGDGNTVKGVWGEAYIQQYNAGATGRTIAGLYGSIRTYNNVMPPPKATIAGVIGSIDQSMWKDTTYGVIGRYVGAVNGGDHTFYSLRAQYAGGAQMREMGGLLLDSIPNIALQNAPAGEGEPFGVRQVGMNARNVLNGSTLIGSGSKSTGSAILQLNSINRGFLPPRVTTVQRATIGSLKSIQVNVQGSNYVSPTVTISPPAAGGVQATARANVTDGKVVSVDILVPGVGYGGGATVTITDGTGGGATATATVETERGVMVFNVSTQTYQYYNGTQWVDFGGGGGGGLPGIQDSLNARYLKTEADSRFVNLNETYNNPNFIGNISWDKISDPPFIPDECNLIFPNIGGDPMLNTALASIFNGKQDNLPSINAKQYLGLGNTARYLGPDVVESIGLNYPLYADTSTDRLMIASQNIGNTDTLNIFGGNYFYNNSTTGPKPPGSTTGQISLMVSSVNNYHNGANNAVMVFYDKARGIFTRSFDGTSHTWGLFDTVLSKTTADGIYIRKDIGTNIGNTDTVGIYGGNYYYNNSTTGAKPVGSSSGQITLMVSSANNLHSGSNNAIMIYYDKLGAAYIRNFNGSTQTWSSITTLGGVLDTTNLFLYNTASITINGVTKSLKENPSFTVSGGGGGGSDYTDIPETTVNLTNATQSGSGPASGLSGYYEGYILADKWVQVDFLITASTPGTGVTSLQFPFPSGLPSPKVPVVLLGKNNIIKAAEIGAVCANTKADPFVSSRAYIKRNDANDGFIIEVSSNSGAAALWRLSFKYKIQDFIP